MPYRPASTLSLTVAFALWGAASHADALSDQIVKRYQELGFDFVEVKEGLTQTKVEAVMGTRKYEVIYDRSTGKILEQEIEDAGVEYLGRSGVEVSSENEDFLDEDDLEDDEDDDDDDEDGDEHDDGDEADEGDDDEDDDETDSDEDDDDESDESDESDENDGGSDEGSDSDEGDDD